MGWETIGLGALVSSVGCARDTARHRASQLYRIRPLAGVAAAGCLIFFVAASVRGADPPVLWLDNEDVLEEATAQNSGMYSNRRRPPPARTAPPGGARPA